jgi:molybdopterin-binding protein
MSQIIATIKDIKSIDNLHIVKFNFSQYTILMTSLELKPNIIVGKKVLLAVKPTNISIAKDFQGQISIDNQLKAKIVSIENGKLLSYIKIKIEDTILEAIITLDMSKKLHLKTDDDITVFIEATKLSIVKVFDD